MIKNKTILLTGGTGFIGSHLIERLKGNNKIIIFDNFKRNALKYINSSNLEIIKDSILNISKYNFDNIDIVFHCAAIAGIKSVSQDILNTLEVNLIGSYELLKKFNNIELFVYFSTSEVYGPYVYKSIEDDMLTQGSPGDLRWGYSMSKLAGEHFTIAMAKQKNFNYLNIRPFNIYGPRQIGESAVNNFIERALRNDDIIIHNDGTQIRAWCFVDDFINALLKLIEDKIFNETFNIGNPKETVTVYNLAKKIVSLSNSKSNIIFKEHKEPDVLLRIPSIDKLKQHINFEPVISLEEGILKTIEWKKNNEE